MSTDNTPYYEIIDFAANEKPSEFVNKFNEIMFKKAYDAVEKYKQDIANNYFGQQPEAEEEKEEETSDENA
ncbi:hypothetical protein EBR43_05005 [bacterium]|nr:hypothetical protein [bacterium]